MGSRIWQRFSTNIPYGQFPHSQWKNKKHGNALLLMKFRICIHPSSFQKKKKKTSPHTWQFVCLQACVCPFLSHSAGLGHRGFSDGVGGLCFVAQSSKSCLSVLSSWTSCNNINGPLNKLLCCAALAWVTSHTCTLSHSETHTDDGACWQLHTHAHKFIPKSHSHMLTPTGGCSDMLASTNVHRYTQQYTVNHN